MTLTPLRLSTFKSSTTCRAVELSNPVVGSSKNSMDGLVSNSTPIDVLFLSPPEIPRISEFPTLVFLHLVRPNSLIKRFTLSVFCSSFKFFSLRSAVSLNASTI